MFFLAALVGEPARRELHPAHVALCVCAAAATVMFATLGRPLAALTASGVALAAGALIVACLRGRDDGDDGGGEREDPPSGPHGGDSIDWERFEAEFREYAARRLVAS